MVTISYGITVKDELKELQKLLPLLLQYKREEDEIVVLFDLTNGDKKIVEYLEPFSRREEIKLVQDYFENHFAKWKNILSSCCSKDFIFQIDADELPNMTLLESLPDLLDNNDIDVYLVPRVNTVEGLTEGHIQKWGWRINSKGWVNWPDTQWRLYRNSPEIKWKNKVHEVLTGFKTFNVLPSYEELALYHHKDINRQEKQNKFYDTL